VSETVIIIGVISTLLGIQVAIIGVAVKLASRITALETKVDVFWKGVSVDVAKLLHSPHIEHRRRDELIEKYIADDLNLKELDEFINVLEKTKREGNEQEKFYAAYLLNVIRIRYNLHSKTHNA
jgi:F0F1-type ATP synthase delta subunit